MIENSLMKSQIIIILLFHFIEFLAFQLIIMNLYLLSPNLLILYWAFKMEIFPYPSNPID